MTTGNTLDIVRAIEEKPARYGAGDAAGERQSAGRHAGNGRRVCFYRVAGAAGCFQDFTPEALHAQPLIAFESGSGTRALIDGWFAANGLAIAPVMQLGSIEAIKRMVRAGLGYSIVPRMAVEQDADREGLCVMSLTPMLQRQLAVVMRQDKIVTKGIAEMLRLLHAVR